MGIRDTYDAEKKKDAQEEQLLRSCHQSAARELESVRRLFLDSGDNSNFLASKGIQVGDVVENYPDAPSFMIVESSRIVLINVQCFMDVKRPYFDYVVGSKTRKYQRGVLDEKPPASNLGNSTDEASRRIEADLGRMLAKREDETQDA